MQKKILITGATGFIGSHLVELLLEEKVPIDNLRLLVREKSILTNLPKKDLDIVKGDIRNKRAVEKAMEGVETVYHLAAITSFAATTYEEYKEINVDGTQNLLDTCINKNIQKFVLFSSIAVYGLPAWVGDIINWDETHPKTYSDIYGKSKLEAEKRVIRAYQKWKIPYAIIRPASVYGPRDKGQLFELYRVIKRHQFVMIGDGTNKMHFVYVRDLVKGARQIQLNNKKESDYILAGEKPTVFKDIVSYVAKSINEPVPKWHMPKSLGLLISYFLDTSGKIIGIRSPLFPSRVRVMTANYYYNIGRARQEFGFQPQVSFQQGTTITGKWYLDNAYL